MTTSGDQLVTTQSRVDDGRDPWDECKTNTKILNVHHAVTHWSPLGRGLAMGVMGEIREMIVAHV